MKPTSCRQDERVCGSMMRVWASDYCNRFSAFLSPEGQRCPLCIKQLNMDDIKTRSGQAVYRPVSQGRPK